MSPWNQNRLTAMLGITYPIIQGPLGGLSSERLTAAVSNFGGLGSFGALGAVGVQMGTVFLACEESGASRLHREALLQRALVRDLST